MEELIQSKLQNLKNELKKMKKAAISFSSGVDSTFLLKTAHDVLGDNAIAITARSCLFPRRELEESSEFCRANGIKQLFIDIEALEIPGFDKNPKDRCYICKRFLFQQIIKIAEQNGIENVCEGSNTDDTKDYRPGLKAVAELEVKSPLRDAEFSKAEIRKLSKEMNLATWNKPSFACLASRFAYGEKIDKESLKMIEEAEQFLLNSGFSQMRVRLHGKIARIEILPDDFSLMLKESETINRKLKDLGFAYVTMDLQGYRTGSMNESFFKEDSHGNI